MKFLILFAVGVLFGSVQCDDECFRAVFRECVREPVPMERMTLCDEVQYEINCIARFAKKCNMNFNMEAQEFAATVNTVCHFKSLRERYNKYNACYMKNILADECIKPIKDSVVDPLNPENAIRANKQYCSLFNSYSSCVDKVVREQCGSEPWTIFQAMYKPLQSFSNSLCKELIVPADEKDIRPDNFGNINVLAGVASLFYSPEINKEMY